VFVSFYVHFFKILNAVLKSPNRKELMFEFHKK